jgi:hypothetical protein
VGSWRWLALTIVLLGAVGTAVIIGYVRTVLVEPASIAEPQASGASSTTGGDDTAHAA